MTSDGSRKKTKHTTTMKLKNLDVDAGERLTENQAAIILATGLAVVPWLIGFGIYTLVPLPGPRNLTLFLLEYISGLFVVFLLFLIWDGVR